MTCAYEPCHNLINPIKKPGPPRQYCSQRCNDRAWRARDPEHARAIDAAKTRRYYARYPERVKATVNAGRAKNPEMVKAINRRAYRKRVETDPGEERAKSRARLQAWRLANPEKSRDQVNRRRALRLAVPSEKIDERDIFEADGWVCNLCRLPVDPSLRFPDPGSASLDHIVPLTKGGHHVHTNVQLAHFGCNSRKRDK